MGQHLSLLRPHFSLAWMLREQQQPPTHDTKNSFKQANKQAQEAKPTKVLAELLNRGLRVKQKKRAESLRVLVQLGDASEHNWYHAKGGPSTESLNGYANKATATTPAVTMDASQLKFSSNPNLLDWRHNTHNVLRSELFFMCTPQRLPKRYGTKDAVAVVKKRNEIRKKHTVVLRTKNAHINNGTVAKIPTNIHVDKHNLLNGFYSKPGLNIASEGDHRRHQQLKRHNRSYLPKFGYEIGNVEEFLSQCSLAIPGNIPVVLSSSSILYQTRPVDNQVVIPLPLGMVVNAIFKNQNWLYVQTPHAEEGYVCYACCLPLGILPIGVRGNVDDGDIVSPKPCWDSNSDVFPRPCGNMTNTKKEMRLCGDLRSDGAGKSCSRRKETIINTSTKGKALLRRREADSVAGHAFNHGEHKVDKLYLRAASQSKQVENPFGKLRLTKTTANSGAPSQFSAAYTVINNECLIQFKEQKSRLHAQKRMCQQQQTQQIHHKQAQSYGSFGINAHNLHPKMSITTLIQQRTASSHNGTLLMPQYALHAVVQQPDLSKTLHAINMDYTAVGIAVKEGDVVLQLHTS